MSLLSVRSATIILALLPQIVFLPIFLLKRFGDFNSLAPLGMYFVLPILMGGGCIWSTYS